VFATLLSGGVDRERAVNDPSEEIMYLRHGDISWDHPDGSDAGAVTALASTAAHFGPHLPGGIGGKRRSASHDRASSRLPTIDLCNVKLHRITELECVRFILDEIAHGRGGVVVTPNLDHLRRCVRDLHFGALVAEADVVVADGMPLVWASRLQRTPLPERVAGSNLISSLSKAGAVEGRSVFLLGGAEGTAQGAAEILRKRHPELKVVGTYCPQIGFESKPKQMAEIVQMLCEAKPDIVFVALGSPKQEHLIAKLKPSLDTAWWLGVGVSFSFLTGHVKRAPLWMQRAGVEWLHRLLQEPRRLFKRYIVSGVPFAARLFTQSTVHGLAGRFGRKTVSANTRELDETQNPIAPVDGTSDLPGSGMDRLASRARRMTTAPMHDGKSLSRLKAVVLLGGAVRATPLSTSIGRSLLDLPLDEHGSVLNHWLNHATELARAVGLEKLPVRVMVDRNSPEPISAAVKYYGTFRVERDQSEYRGTGGVLRDLALKYDDNDLILVANAAQILLDPLVALTTTLDQRHGDMAIISHRDGTPSGIMLVSVKTLRLIPETGFIDLKEQAMPLIAQNFAVEVLHRRRPTGLPIRSVNDYINAMRYYHMRKAGRSTLTDPLAEDWQPSFGIVEEGAVVDRTARVHDSVVLRGGVVESGAVLVRSFVCPSGLVRKDKVLVDEFVKPVTQGRALVKVEKAA
jgi:N-acetylglucosaminyldiphosphoundecaprenol N-acetyl-beta-D-mannosaminyltransferase